jgi:hypothetical protein
MGVRLVACDLVNATWHRPHAHKKTGAARIARCYSLLPNEAPVTAQLLPLRLRASGACGSGGGETTRNRNPSNNLSQAAVRRGVSRSEIQCMPATLHVQSIAPDPSSDETYQEDV